MYFKFSGLAAAALADVAMAGLDSVCTAVGLRPSMRSRSGGRDMDVAAR